MRGDVETAAPSPGNAMRLLPIPIDSLDYRAHALDMYIWHRSEGEPALYRAAGTEFTAEDASRLASQKIEFLYINATQHKVYREALAGRLEAQFQDESLSRQERARVVRTACARMIEDVLLFPGQAEPLDAVVEMAGRFTSWSESDPATFSYMLEMSDHDFYTTTHMVNVGVGCGLLASRLRGEDREFSERLCTGGLLHDVGKRGVPEDVLNKEGKLSEEEWQMVRQHPLLGHEELACHERLPQEVLEMAMDHHERPDGTGYPNGRSGAELSLPARICAVVDVFDALTAARPYRGPMPPANALKIMEEGVGTQFDELVFRTWRELVDELVCEDPSRAPPEEPAEKFGSLEQYRLGSGARVGEEVAERGSTLGLDNRRRFERHAVSLAVELEFVRPLKAYPVGTGERFKVRAVDLSRGGMQVETPWPLAMSDLVVVHLTTPKGPVCWRARVVRVRSSGKGWRAGLQFLGRASDAAAA